MKQKFSLILGILCSVGYLFSQENVERYYYTSTDVEGYISIEKTDITNGVVFSTTLNTTVKANFNDSVLDFSLTTINDTDKMVAPIKIIFDGTIDASIKPVHFTGTRIKKSEKNVSYWSFDGDFIDEMETDPDFKHFAYAKHSATLRLPDRTIPSFNLWSIIPKLPFDTKGTFRFNTLDETKLYVKKNQTVNYLGYTKIPINGKIIKLHKFVHQGKTIQPSYYWVNEARELVQVLLDNKYTFTINTRNAALKDSIISDSIISENIN